jgi:hypothetical protein
MQSTGTLYLVGTMDGTPTTLYYTVLHCTTPQRAMALEETAVLTADAKIADRSCKGISFGHWCYKGKLLHYWNRGRQAAD